jgi:hypothetical protein
MMDQLERVLSVASGDQLAYTGNAAEWTAQRTQVRSYPWSTLMPRLQRHLTAV